MRRVLFAFSGLLILLILAGVLFRVYRQRQSYAVAVPKEASSVIRIHVDGLATDIIWNMLWHPSYYQRYRQDTSGDAKGVLRGSAGVRVPANVFLYQFADVPHAVFGMLPITDAEAFSAFVLDQEKWEYETEIMPRRLSSSYGLALHTADTVAFAFLWGGGKEQMKAIEVHLQDMLQQKQLTPLAKSRFSELKKQKGHINASGDRSLWMEFRQGEIVFSAGAEWDNKLPWEFPANNTGMLQVPASYWSQAQWDRWQWGNSGALNRDSLMRYIRGSSVVQWSGVTTQSDTVITYEYDDDFNPIETRTAVDQTVPMLYGTIPADAPGLISYLAGQGIVDTVSGQISRDVFPFFSVYLDRTDSAWLRISSVASAAEKRVDIPIRSDGKDSLYFYLNISDAIGQDVFPTAIAQLLAPFSALALQGSYPEGGSVIRGKLAMKEAYINSLMQLYPLLGRPLPEEPVGDMSPEYP